MARKDTLGLLGEAEAERYLTDGGFEVLARRWRCPLGELDLVALEGDCLVVVEVKTRSSAAFGHPFEAIDRRKLQRLRALAREWASAHAPERGSRALRVDAVAVTMRGGQSPVIEHLRGIS